MSNKKIHDKIKDNFEYRANNYLYIQINSKRENMSKIRHYVELIEIYKEQIHLLGIENARISINSKAYIKELQDKGYKLKEPILEFWQADGDTSTTETDSDAE